MWEIYKLFIRIWTLSGDWQLRILNFSVSCVLFDSDLWTAPYSPSKLSCFVNTSATFWYIQKSFEWRQNYCKIRSPDSDDEENVESTH